MPTSETHSAALHFADDLTARLDAAIARSQTAFLRQQHGEGFWHAPLEANVSMDAQYIFLNRFMGRSMTRVDRRVVDHMLATQSADGSWPLYAGGPGHLSDTIEAYFALKLAGLSADEAPLRRAREFIRAHGGLAKAGVFTRTFLAYFGQFSWQGLPAMPVELVLLPPWFPINIYAMSSWARETVVPLTVLMAKRPQVPIDPREAIDELNRYYFGAILVLDGSLRSRKVNGVFETRDPVAVVDALEESLRLRSTRLSDLLILLHR